MKSNSAGPGRALDSRRSSATDACPSSIKAATIAGSVASGAGAPARGGAAGCSSGRSGTKSRDRRWPATRRRSAGRTCRTRPQPRRGSGRCQVASDVDEQPPPAACIGRGGGELAQRRSPAASWGRSSSAGDRRRRRRGSRRSPAAGIGKQRGDRPALDDVEVVIGQAPLDVLRAAEVRLDLPRPSCASRTTCGIRQRRPCSANAARPAIDRRRPHLVDVRIHAAGDQRLSQPEAGLHARQPSGWR